MLRRGADDADGFIYTAFGLGFSKYVELSQEDRVAIETFGEVLAGSDRPIVVTSGLGAVPDGQRFTEDTRPPVMPDYPRVGAGP